MNEVPCHMLSGIQVIAKFVFLYLLSFIVVLSKIRWSLVPLVEARHPFCSNPIKLCFSWYLYIFLEIMEINVFHCNGKHVMGL